MNLNCVSVPRQLLKKWKMSSQTFSLLHCPAPFSHKSSFFLFTVKSDWLKKSRRGETSQNQSHSLPNEVVRDGDYLLLIQTRRQLSPNSSWGLYGTFFSTSFSSFPIFLISRSHELTTKKWRAKSVDLGAIARSRQLFGFVLPLFDSDSLASLTYDSGPFLQMTRKTFGFLPLLTCTSSAFLWRWE